MNKDNIIKTAIECGYFKVKREELKTELFEQVCEELKLEETPNDILVTLTEETQRRSDVYHASLQRKIQREMDNAKKPLMAGQDSHDEHVVEFTETNKTYILTGVQNNTDVNKVFLTALETYAKEHDAQILCAKITYNKNGFTLAQDTDDDGVYYDPLITKYLVDGHIALNKNIHFIGQANVMPTAKNPLSGFEAITQAGVSAVIPASKIALKCLARLKGSQGKILFGTGMLTKRNYILRKAGAVAATEHNIGALIVKVRGNEFEARHVELMDGSDGFYDEGVFYSHKVVSFEPPMAIQLGDIHAEKADDYAIESVIDLLRYYKPEHLFIHDVMDFSSRNHHNIKDCAFIYNQTVNGTTVEGECQIVADFLSTVAPYADNIHIVESNHDLAINTWLKNTDFKQDPQNALFYLRCMYELYKYIDLTGSDDFNMLEFVMKDVCELQDNSIIYHKVDDSILLAGIEHGIHGHIGVNGSRGSPAGFKNLGVKLNTGHTHTPSIIGGVYTAGVTGSLDMGYNKGASSWQLAHIITYKNGQRQIIFM
jgi:hypothetical protein